MPAAEGPGRGAGGVRGGGGARDGAARGAPQRIRIIGGAWRRTPIPVVDAPGLRPTPDRVRETLFNWLGQRLDGWVCADLFAGTGALGLEAASRGAAEVIAVERDARALAALRALKDRLGAGALRVVAGDAAAVARELAAARAGAFDLVFLDPPFGAGWPQRMIADAAAMLAPGGLAYLEAEAPADAAWLAPAGLEPLRAASAGQVHYHLLRKVAPAAAAPAAVGEGPGAA